jgi:hypothetical protein
MGVAAACDIAREDVRTAGAMITGLAAANMRGFDAGLTRPDAGDRNAGGAPIFTHPADGGIPAGSDLLFLVRANGALAPVTHQHPGTPAPRHPRRGTP